MVSFSSTTNDLQTGAISEKFLKEIINLLHFYHVKRNPDKNKINYCNHDHSTTTQVVLCGFPVSLSIIIFSKKKKNDHRANSFQKLI